MANYVLCVPCNEFIYKDSMGTVRNKTNGLRHKCAPSTTTTTKETTMKSAKMLVTITRKEANKQTAQDMIIGQIGEADYFGRKILVLRAYNMFVNLLNPSETFAANFDKAVDILPDGSTVTLTVASGLTAEAEAKILEQLRTGNLIMAIKEVRTATGLGLSEAKKYAEEFRQKAWDDGSLPKTYTTRYPGNVAPLSTKVEARLERRTGKGDRRKLPATDWATSGLRMGKMERKQSAYQSTNRNSQGDRRNYVPF